MQKILIIDDDPIMIKLYQGSLKNHYEMISENYASKGISAAIKENPKAILLDLHMPNVDGFEVLSQLRNHPGTSSIPVICISGDENEASRNRAYQLGSIGFITKPPNPKTFSDDIAGFLSSMNSIVASSDNNKKFVIAFNEKEKMALMDQNISEIDFTKNKIVLLSWKSWEEFSRPEYSHFIESDFMAYLKIKPTLITKLPFMQDLSPITHDIDKLLFGSHESYILIFDEPSLLFDQDGGSNVKAKVFAFNEVISKSFSVAWFFSTRSRDPSKEANLHNLARALFNEF